MSSCICFLKSSSLFRKSVALAQNKKQKFLPCVDVLNKVLLLMTVYDLPLMRLNLIVYLSHKFKLFVFILFTYCLDVTSAKAQE